MAKDIIKMFPKHKTYVEVFGGAGHILFMKPRSGIEIYNDINQNLTDFFDVLRENGKELKVKLDLTPYSRSEHKKCCNSWENESNKIEKVRKWYVALMQSFNQVNGSWSYSIGQSRRNMSQSVSQWLGKIEKNLPKAVNRLKSVQIENLDFKKLIPKYDTEDTLFYMDPPYVHETRIDKNSYDFEMSNQSHKEMIDLILNARGKVILSGYENKLYKPLSKNGWRKEVLGEYSKRASNKSEKSYAKEMIWFNFDKEGPNQTSLF